MHAVEEGVRQDCPQRILFNDGASYETMSWSDLRPLVMMTTQVYFRRITQVYSRRNKTTTVWSVDKKEDLIPLVNGIGESGAEILIYRTMNYYICF